MTKHYGLHGVLPIQQWQVLWVKDPTKLEVFWNYSFTYNCCSGLSKFFGIPLVPGLGQSQVGKSGAMTIKSRFYLRNRVPRSVMGWSRPRVKTCPKA